VVTFYPEECITNFIIEAGQREKMPGMSGGLLDVRPYIKKMIIALYEVHHVFTQIPGNQLEAPVADKILSQIGQGLEANVANLAFFYPPLSSKHVIADIGVALEIPGMKGGLFDTRKYVVFAVDKLTAMDYYLTRLSDEPATSALWQKLWANQPAVIAEW
jgi:hypothetical protein